MVTPKIGVLFVTLFAMTLAACVQTKAAKAPTHHFIAQVDAQALKKITDDGADLKEIFQSALSIIDARLEAMEANAKPVRQKDNGLIHIEISGLDSREMVETALGIPAELEFRLVDTSAKPAEVMKGIVSEGSEIFPMADGSLPIAVKRAGGLSGERIVDAVSGMEDLLGASVVNLMFDKEGAHQFAQLTKANVGNPLAIILEGEVVSAPIIIEPILGGTVQISGNFTQEEANKLAIRLNSGARSSKFSIIEHRIVK